MQHVLERARFGARVAPVGDEELRIEPADVPRGEIALRQDVRPGPVEERRLALVVAVLERAQRTRRGEAARLGERALQPLGGARDLEVDRAEARLAEIRR